MRALVLSGLVGAALAGCLALDDFPAPPGVDVSGDVSSEPVTASARIVGAYPAKKQPDGNWARVCRMGEVDGIVTNAVYLAERPPEASDEHEPNDSDVSLRPLDVVGGRRIGEGSGQGDVDLASSTNVGLVIDCSFNVTVGGNDCFRPVSTLDAIRYAANTSDRSRAHDVVLLIDQSGSIGGLVRDGDFHEERIPNPLPTDFGAVASDRTGARLAAARHLLDSLDPDDRFAALAFGEAIALSVPCTTSIADVTQDLTTCFAASDRSVWTFDGLQATIGGRSNLWGAVRTAYDFLRAHKDAERSSHVVVLTDGPDTCAGENRKTCATPCTTAAYDELVATLERDASAPGGSEIHVHFVQFESLGYPGRDPRQVEVACLSGGHYQYVNANVFPRSDGGAALREALVLAVANVRFSLMGHWELAALAPGYESMPPGGLYGLQGALALRASSNLVATDTSFAFGVGQGAGAESAVDWDRRATLRKPCGGFQECGAAVGPASCQIVCSSETLTCADRANATQLPDLAPCDEGGSGFCCGGVCQSAGTCAACND